MFSRGRIILTIISVITIMVVIIITIIIVIIIDIIIVIIIILIIITIIILIIRRPAPERRDEESTPGLHNKIPPHKIFARVWVAQKSFFVIGSG